MVWKCLGLVIVEISYPLRHPGLRVRDDVACHSREGGNLVRIEDDNTENGNWKMQTNKKAVTRSYGFCFPSCSFNFCSSSLSRARVRPVSITFQLISGLPTSPYECRES